MGDWSDSTCTHLVCAFANTPKFNQVKSGGVGKIVGREWVERCHKDRKRFPWRRFCIDKSEKKTEESEEEIWEEEEMVVTLVSHLGSGLPDKRSNNPQTMN